MRAGNALAASPEAALPEAASPEAASPEAALAEPAPAELDDSGDLVEAVETRLRRSLYLELRRVVCTLRDGILTLEGCVSSYYLRQIAQSLIEGAAGVEAIDNQLQVMPGRPALDRLVEE